jgi:hypothetical protein
MAQDTVETAIYRLQVEGMAQIRELTSHIDGLAIAEEKATSSTRKFSQGLQDQIARGDQTVRIMENIRKAAESYERYAETGLGTQAGLGTQQQLAAYYEVTNNKIAEQTRKLEELAVANENVRRAQATTAAGPGITAQRAGGMDAYAAQFEAAAKAQDEQVASINRLRAAMNPLEVEQGKIGTQMAIYRTALKDGKISQTEYAAAQEQAGAALRRHQQVTDAMGNSTKMARYEMINLGRQAQDVFVSLAGGQNILMVAIQQGSQIWDVFASSGRKAGDIFKGIASGMASFITSLPGVVTGVLAVGAALAYAASQAGAAQKAMDLSMIGAGRRTGSTAADINQFAARTAAERPSGGMSEKEVRALGEAFTAAGDIVVKNVSGMNVAVMGFAEKTKVSVAEASDAWVKFGSDPVKAMDELAKTFGEFDQRTRNAALATQAAGDKTRAMQIIVNSLTPELQKAADTAGFWTKGWRDFVNLLATPVTRPVGITEKLKEAEKELEALEEQSKNMFFSGPQMDTSELDKARQKVAQLKEEMANAPANAIAEQAKVTAQAIAQATKNMQEQLGVANAVGGAQRRSAQYALDYATVLDQAKNAAVAVAVATERQAIAQAQVNAQAKETLFNLQNQAAAAAAVTGAEQMKAQAAATYNQLVHDGVDWLIAQQVAAKQLANAHAQANAAVEKQIQSLEDSTRLIKAQARGMGESEERAIAYDNAIKSGANATEAAALSSAMLSNQMAKAAASAGSYASNMQAATQAMMGAAGRGWTPDQTYVATSFQSRAAGEPGSFVGSGSGGGSVETSLWPRAAAESLAQQAANAKSFSDQVASMGSIQAGLAFAMGAQAHGAFQQQAAGVAPGGQGIPTGQFYTTQQAVTEQDIISQVTSLYQTLNQQNPAAQAANMQAEMQWLQSRPTSIAQQQAIAQLQQSIQGLTKSTDQLNATNQELLSPYYTQDPRTSHIGFRSQGMATGGWVDVPGGYSANDNMIATIPVASGERIFVDPMGARRTATGPGHTTINISQPILIQGNADRDQLGRTLFQSNQGLAKQIGAATAR